jgi:hypothetical protein
MEELGPRSKSELFVGLCVLAVLVTAAMPVRLKQEKNYLPPTKVVKKTHSPDKSLEPVALR